MPDSRQTIIYRFTKTHDFRILPVNCIWGGRTGRGDIMVNLCNEAHALPETVVHAQTSDGNIGEELSREPFNVVDRTAFAAMVLTAEQAHSIGEWLMARAAEARQLAEQQKGGGDDRPATAH